MLLAVAQHTGGHQGVGSGDVGLGQQVAQVADVERVVFRGQRFAQVVHLVRCQVFDQVVQSLVVLAFGHVLVVDAAHEQQGADEQQQQQQNIRDKQAVGHPEKYL